MFQKKKERWKFNKDKGMVNPKVGGGSFFVSYDKQFFYKAYIKKIKHYFFVTSRFSMWKLKNGYMYIK